jgi:stress-induced morphogen
VNDWADFKFIHSFMHFVVQLQEALSPTVLVVDDVSHQHAGHAGVHKGATETHFK